jgi:DNA-binding MarR family transcriptional regulator
MADDRVKESDEAILREIALHHAPVISAADLSDRLSITGPAVRKRLEKFEEKGWVKHDKVGARAVVWWLTDEGKEQLSSGAG